MKTSPYSSKKTAVTEMGAFIRLVSIGSIFILLIVMMIGFLSGCSAEGSINSDLTYNFPGSGFPVDASMEWVMPEDAGWSSEELQDVHEFAIQSSCQAVLALYDGKVFFSRGNIHRNYAIDSIREPLLSALYGIYSARGDLEIDATLEDLQIDDLVPSLTPAEKQARIVDLLMSRSGVYHEAADENQSMIDTRPARGSYDPDAFFYYNNWDINALGTIFEQETGIEIFEAFKDQIADALEMVDFDFELGFYEYEWAKSLHPAFHISMSARDLAKFGVLYQKGGVWDGNQVIEPDWIDDSTLAYSTMDQTTGVGYGYMWKTFEDQTGLEQMIGYPGYFHTGNGGDVLLVIPDLKLVIVQRYDGQLDWDEAGSDSFELTQRILDARL
jgi:hypothetical protein